MLPESWLIAVWPSKNWTRALFKPAAEVLGITVVELRQRLTPGRICFAGWCRQRDEAERLCTALRRLELPAVCEPLSRLSTLEQMIEVQHFRLGEREIVLGESGVRSVAYKDIRVIIHARRPTDMKKRIRSAGRLAAAAQRLMQPAVRTQEDAPIEYKEWSYEQALYLFGPRGNQPVCFRETRFIPVCLEELMCSGRRENLLSVLHILRARAQQARFDDNLLAFRPAIWRWRRKVFGDIDECGAAQAECDLLASMIVSFWSSGLT